MPAKKKTFWENTHRMITLEQIQDIWKQELVWDQLLYRCHGRWRLNRGPPPSGTNAHALFFLSKSREILGQNFFLLSASSVSVQPLPRSHLDWSRNWYTRYLDFWAVFACCFEARCLFNIRGVCVTVCEPLPLTRDLGVGYVLFQNTIQAWQELLKFWFRFKFHLQLQKNKDEFDI